MIGNLRKMKTHGVDPVHYQLALEEIIELNDYIGKKISLKFKGVINCIACGRKTNKSFAQGFCYPCFRDAPEMSPCIIRPELCEGHLGKGRDPEWELAHHVQPHIVYLAISSGLKVGVTRDTQIPTRWIDQGANHAIILAKTDNRYQAGVIEVTMKEFASDKTSWQKMLKNDIPDEIELIEEKEKLRKHFPDELSQFYELEHEVISFVYPVEAYPEKVKSIGFDKMPEIEKVLKGIKGQYLIFEDDTVLNIRKHSGYLVEFSA